MKLKDIKKYLTKHKADVTKAISKQIEQIALNTLKYPYKDAYAELYREFVVPMIEGQGY